MTVVGRSFRVVPLFWAPDRAITPTCQTPLPTQLKSLKFHSFLTPYADPTWTYRRKAHQVHPRPVRLSHHHPRAPKQLTAVSAEASGGRGTGMRDSSGLPTTDNSQHPADETQTTTAASCRTRPGCVVVSPGETVTMSVPSGEP